MSAWDGVLGEREWEREIRQTRDAAPFMPELCEALEARGITAEWIPEPSVKGFYRVAMRRDGVGNAMAWVRLHGFQTRDGWQPLIEIARVLPREEPREFVGVVLAVPLTIASADPSFVADALSGATWGRDLSSALTDGQAATAMATEIARRQREGTGGW